MAGNRGAGQLTERVGWWAEGSTTDTYENPVPGPFAEQFQCRAGFTYLRGSEAVMASRLQGRQPIVVRVRSSSETRQIKPSWQMRNARTGDIFAVRSIAATPDRMWLDVMVESGVAS